MKFLLYLTITFFFSVQNTSKLNGTYNVIYDKGQQGYQITFSDSIYAKKMPDASIYKSRIDYGKFKVVIRRDKDEDPIEIDNREIGKDTIHFATKSKRNVSTVVNRGLMIRIK